MTLSFFSILFIVANAALLFWLPSRWAAVPLLVGTCYMTLGQGIQVGPFHFPIIRLFIAFGLCRVILRGEPMAGGMNGMDWLMLLWSAWALVSSYFHNDPVTALIYRLGFVFNCCGIYILIRVFCRSIEDMKNVALSTAVLLMPIAAAMLYERYTAFNVFSFFGGVSAGSEIRLGEIRAQGPFSHSILAGTVGASCLPFMAGIWREHRRIAFVGIVSCLAMVAACASSGPILSSMAGIGALLLWRFRDRMRIVQWCAVLGYIALDMVMKAPAYYLIGRIDLTGGSTGWHRAALIESSLKHLNEWWLAGTDYTVHWMPTGLASSQYHTDITNHYIRLGVIGGAPLMMLYIAILAKGFAFVGRAVEQSSDSPSSSKFTVWAMGSALFVHAVTSISVSYFDQSIVFPYLILGCIGSLCYGSVMAKADSGFQMANAENSWDW
jgi:hypothetical protein